MHATFDPAPVWRALGAAQLDDALAYFLDLRLRLRGRPEAVALVDRCLRLIACAEGAGPADLAGLQAEVEALRAELAARFGPKARLTVH